jgi:hypothetical protein
MKSEIEQQLTAAVDLLSSMQLVALYLGSVELVDDVLDDPHPRKHNVPGRANAAQVYQRVLSIELSYQLPDRDPAKAKRIADEMQLSNEPALRQLAHSIQERLAKAKSNA